MSLLARSAVFLWVSLFASVSYAQNFSYSDNPLLSVINDIEDKTEYRFLYREALISDITVTFQASESTLMDEFTKSLENKIVGINVDESRKQVLLFRKNKTPQSEKLTVSGVVVDSETGERLPFATISWRNKGELNGVNSDKAGHFTINTETSSEELSVLVSFVGYTSERIVLQVTEQKIWSDIAVRLTPEPFAGKEIVVRGFNFYTASDTVMDGLIKSGTFSPLGENNSVRSLQMLPAVNMTSAMTNGINIRGSSSDGFRVLLDGQTIYHQSHLFGLMDPMNPDVLITSGFYYDIAPAQYQAPLGGTLSLITRTGSLNKLKGTAGISNTAFRSTFEGPLVKGKSSWLLSGRFSFMDELNWMNNQQLIEYGLDVNRPAEIIFEQEVPDFIRENVSLNSFQIDDTQAQFYDIHAKTYFETRSGSQISISGYIGHDDALQDYFRDEADVVNLYRTDNTWTTQSISGNFNSRLSTLTTSESRVGYTIYKSEFSKGDFEYQIRSDDSQETAQILGNLELENDLQQFDLSQEFSTAFNDFTLTYGISYSDFDVQYTEFSLARSAFRSRRTSQLVDVFQQADIDVLDDINLYLGNRLHYFSNGRYLRWSPRFKFTLYADEPISFNAGYSRNYQFINKVQFYNINSSDFWILTNEDQPPSSVDYYSAGIHIRPHQSAHFQIESYLKNFENLRLHELNTGLISASFQNLDVPIFYENEGLGMGVEFLVKNRYKRVGLTAAYSVSSMELKNDLINAGEYYYADWDRRHQLSVVGEVLITEGLEFFVSWMFGTGTPDNFDSMRFADTPRQDNYSRVDVTLNYAIQLQNSSIKASGSLYNLLDRDNPWYSEVRQVTFSNRNGERLARARTDIYDLGIHPSFSIGFYF